MSLLKNLVGNAVREGLSKGIRDAVSNAAEKIVAPKAEEYANKMAGTLSEAAQAMEGAAPAEASSEKKGGMSSLEESLNKLSQAAEKYAATLEQASANLEDLEKEWNARLEGFPVWCFGCKEFWFSDMGTTSDGNTYWCFNADGATEESLQLYVALLKESGFVRKYPTSDDVLYKDLGGEYLVFGKTDAFGTAPVMSVTMCRTKDRSEIEA